MRLKTLHITLSNSLYNVRWQVVIASSILPCIQQCTLSTLQTLFNRSVSWEFHMLGSPVSITEACHKSFHRINRCPHQLKFYPNCCQAFRYAKIPQQTHTYIHNHKQTHIFIIIQVNETNYYHIDGNTKRDLPINNKICKFIF